MSHFQRVDRWTRGKLNYLHYSNGYYFLKKLLKQSRTKLLILSNSPGPLQSNYLFMNFYRQIENELNRGKIENDQWVHMSEMPGVSANA